jgi:hypothetical protein
MIYANEELTGSHIIRVYVDLCAGMCEFICLPESRSLVAAITKLHWSL